MGEPSSNGEEYEPSIAEGANTRSGREHIEEEGKRGYGEEYASCVREKPKRLGRVNLRGRALGGRTYD